MVKMFLILIFAVIAAVFSVINPHPVAVSLLPDTTMLFPLNMVIFAGLLAGAGIAGVVFLSVAFGSWARIRGLKKKIKSLEKRLNGYDGAESEIEEKFVAEAAGGIEYGRN